MNRLLIKIRCYEVHVFSSNILCEKKAIFYFKNPITSNDFLFFLISEVIKLIKMYIINFNEVSKRNRW